MSKSVIKFSDSCHFKFCPRCEKTLPTSEFHKDSGSSDGLYGYCKYCKYQTNKIYFSSPKGRKAVSGQTKRKWLRVKLKVSARNKLNKAIIDGLIVKGPCYVCNHPDVEAHHDDYSKPLEVRWLCRKHHNELHGKRLSKV